MNMRTLISRQRQRLSQEAEQWLELSYLFETKPFITTKERAENLRNALDYRKRAAKCKEDLERLRRGSFSQKLAGWG